jgi:mono/diheme cytochrome c family protein
MRFPFCLLLTLFGTTALLAEDPSPPAKPVEATFQATLKPFLATYCTGCHGEKLQKGERRFDTLPAVIDGDNTLVDYQDILDQLNLGNMPPEKAKQPPDAERRKVVEWLTDTLETHHQSKKTTGGDAVLRRLNSREYKNTVRDLLHLNMTMFDPTVSFPRDQTSDHLDNQGGTLVTSGHLLARYLTAADQVIQKAMTPREKPAVKTWAFRDGFRQQPEIDQVFRKTNNYAWMTLFDVVGADKHEGAYGPIHAFADGVPYDGYYDIRLRGEAVNRLHPYDVEFIGTDPSEPLRLGIVAGNKLAGPLVSVAMRKNG